MRLNLLTGICVLAVGQALAAESIQQPAVQPNRLTCGSGEVLSFLAQTIQSTNKLSTNLGFDFNAVETKSRVVTRYFIDLKCVAQLRIIDRDDQKITDSLVLTYNLKGGGKNGYMLSFEPQR